MKIFRPFFLILAGFVLFALPASACMNDSECAYDKVCQCPSSSPTGNCSSPGTCVPDGRNWLHLKEAMLRQHIKLQLIDATQKLRCREGHTKVCLFRNGSMCDSDHAQLGKCYCRCVKM